MKTGEHTFREDVYTHSLKYRRWNNQLRPFRSLKKRVANIFQKEPQIQMTVEVPPPINNKLHGKIQ